MLVNLHPPTSRAEPALVATAMQALREINQSKTFTAVFANRSKKASGYLASDDGGSDDALASAAKAAENVYSGGVDYSPTSPAAGVKVKTLNSKILVYAGSR